MSSTTTFLDECLRGTAHVDDVYDWVNRWHDGGGAPEGEQVTLPDYLGLNHAEYGEWLRDSTVLPDLLMWHAYAYQSRTVHYVSGIRRPPVDWAPNALAHR
jgi:hypothetical protein